jgi:hypothetical protein
MISEILEEIGAHIKGKNPAFNAYFAGATQIAEGKVVLLDSRGEMCYVGLDDKRGNFFYIRDVEDVEMDEPEERITSCRETEAELPARLVVWFKRGVQDKIVTAILNDLMTYKSTVPGVMQSRTVPVGVITDYDDLFEAETGRAVTKRIKGITLLALDFNVVFVYRTQAEECLDRNFCAPC